MGCGKSQAQRSSLSVAKLTNNTPSHYLRQWLFAIIVSVNWTSPQLKRLDVFESRCTYGFWSPVDGTETSS
jgi:hypothetical protein